VRSYAFAHREFPHESTIDQWYSESQFESYRALGFEIMYGVLNRACPDSGARMAGLQDLFDSLLKLARRSQALQLPGPLGGIAPEKPTNCGADK
jgi:hypothetical protein